MYSMEKSSNKAGKAPPTSVMVAYGVFVALALAVYHFVAEGEFSAVLTMSVIFQCFAVVLLSLQSLSSGVATGISARALSLEAISLVCRLSSTLWLSGYLPVDASGDYIFQAVDICTLGMVMWLLHRVLVVHRTTYQEEEDTLPIFPMVVGSFLMAALLHADMNYRPLFDALWIAGLFMGILAVLPQLWVIARSNGQVEALTSHYIAAMAVARVLSGMFMWHARFDITCKEWYEGFNHAVWAILLAHALHLLLLADFAYYYVKGLTSKGLLLPLHMDGSCLV